MTPPAEPKKCPQVAGASRFPCQRFPPSSEAKPLDHQILKLEGNLRHSANILTQEWGYRVSVYCQSTNGLSRQQVNTFKKLP